MLLYLQSVTCTSYVVWYVQFYLYCLCVCTKYETNKIKVTYKSKRCIFGVNVKLTFLNNSNWKKKKLISVKTYENYFCSAIP